MIVAICAGMSCGRQRLAGGQDNAAQPLAGIELGEQLDDRDALGVALRVGEQEVATHAVGQDVEHGALAATITARELAAAAGYKNFNGANLQYGNLGKRLREALQFHGDGQESFVLSMFYIPTEQHPEWRFVMHPPVIEALRQLGWFENAEV